MLVLGFQEKERATIVVPPSDEPTTIDVVFTRQQIGRIRLGFAAPKNVAILREGVASRGATLEDVYKEIGR